MPKTKVQKEKALENIKSQINNAKSVVFTDYKGMKMGDLQALRKGIKAKGGKFEITKITLVSKAFDSAKLSGCKKIELDSGFPREEAHKFYERIGFEKRAYLFSKDL